jgi:hypothetical protein
MVGGPHQWMARSARRQVESPLIPEEPNNAIEACAEVPEIRTMAHTLSRWRTEILNHRTGASNGPTEGMNFCAKQVKRAGRGFANFERYRLRCSFTSATSRGPAPSDRHGSLHRVPTETGRARIAEMMRRVPILRPLIGASVENHGHIGWRLSR